jgi:hypothetical protein
LSATLSDFDAKAEIEAYVRSYWISLELVSEETGNLIKAIDTTVKMK